MLMIEIFTTKKKLNTSFMGDIFVENTNTCNLGNNNDPIASGANTSAHGIETIRYIGSTFGNHYQVK